MMIAEKQTTEAQTTEDQAAYSALLKEFDLMVDEPLKKHTSFKIGGPADLLAMPEDVSTLKQLLFRAQELDIPVSLFGGGTNLLVSDKGVRGLVILTRRLRTDLRVSQGPGTKKHLHAGAGERLSSVCRAAVDHSLSGLEFAAGIPGTLGGAVMMNAGSRDHSIADVLTSVTVLDPACGAVTEIRRDALEFSYRHLNLAGIILSAVLTLAPMDQQEIERRFHHNLKQKNATQPVSVASAGCFFKNPDRENPAGRLIEQAGLKGMRINDAMVSDRHANYIVNLGNATCKDVLELKTHIQKTVYQKFHINLETEVRMEGE